MQDVFFALINESPIDIVKLHNQLERMNTVDIAEAFEDLSDDRVLQVFRILPKNMAADIFSFMTVDNQQALVEALADVEVGRIIDELFVDEVVDLIDEMPANVVKRILQNMTADKRQIVNQFLQYPTDSAGGIMTAEYIELREDYSVREAFEHLRRDDSNEMYNYYVVRRDKLLIGTVSLKTLLLAQQHEKISDLMETNIIYVHTLDDQEHVAAVFKKYGYLFIPVVDSEQRLVGVVTADDVVQIIEDEATEDFERMAGIIPTEDTYLKTSVFEHYKSRIGWLLVLMLSATITGTVIVGFEKTIIALPILMTFIPMLMDTSGNAGCQTSTLIIRSIALGEIQMKDILKALWTEVRVAVLCGLGLSIVNFVRILITSGGNAMVAFTVSLTLFTIILLAKSIACLLPFLASRFRLDPAVLAGPVVTTILDGSSLLIFFTVATLLLL
ncbi:MAG: magnesium transporter [Coriobacteriia bacterium]|nr:magnesium transporter [Coriobacteriia bacterium]